MKQISILLALISFGIVQKSVAQDIPIDPDTKKVTYTEVVKVPGMTKDKLYDKAMSVLMEMYKPAAEQKIAVKDKDGGKIVLNGFVKVLLDAKGGIKEQDPALIKYKLTMLFKDGKYKYEFTDFFIDRAGVPFHIERWIEHNKPGDHTFDKKDRVQEHLDFVASDMQRVINELKKGMIAQKAEKNTDW